MALLRSHEFYSGRQSGTGPNLLYTVPAGWLIVLKSISLQNTLSTNKFATISVDNTFTVVTINLGAVGTTGGNFQWAGWVALSAGHVLRYAGTSGSVTDVVLSGYLLFV